MAKSCSIGACTKDAWARGWCPMHYRRWRLNGDPLEQGNVPGGQRSRKTEDALVHRGPALGCWEWTGNTVKSAGHGQVSVDGCNGLVHRFVYEVLIGPIPDDDEVTHRCDNPICYNPIHLALGSQKDNMVDMWQKKRRGLKISSVEVDELHCLYGQGGWTHRRLADKFGVSHQLVGLILKGERRTQDDLLHNGKPRYKLGGMV